MKDTFNSLGIGLTLAVVLIYFMMVTLDKSFLVPFCVHAAVPLILVGVWPMLYFTGIGSTFNRSWGSSSSSGSRWPTRS